MQVSGFGQTKPRKVELNILGYRLMVGHQVLVLSIEVRVLVPQLEKKTPVRVFFRESWGKESLGDFPSRTRSPIELDYERSDII